MLPTNPTARRIAIVAWTLAALLGTVTYTVLAQSQPAPARPAAPGVAAQRTTPRESEARPLRVLFLGSEKAPHSSATVFGPLSSTLARRGIQLIYVPTAAEADMDITPRWQVRDGVS